MPRRVTISYQNTLNAGIETIDRHSVPYAVAESRSATPNSIDGATFANNAG